MGNRERIRNIENLNKSLLNEGNYGFDNAHEEGARYLMKIIIKEYGNELASMVKSLSENPEVKEIAKHIGQGLSTDEISLAFGIASGTAADKAGVKYIYEK